MPYTNTKTSNQNAPLPDQKKFWGGAQPSPHTPPTLERGYPSRDPTPLSASVLVPSALRSAFSFFFIYDSNTAMNWMQTNTEHK